MTTTEVETVDLSIPACVERGATWLDETRPGWWAAGVDAINLATLDMHRENECIIGLLYPGEYRETIDVLQEHVKAAGGPVAQAIVDLPTGWTSAYDVPRATPHVFGFDRVSDDVDKWTSLADEWRRVISQRREAAIADE